jgi:EF hand
MDLAEAKKAAGALFDRLDGDRDGTLDRRELRGRVDAKEFAAVDPDKDGTLTKDEYFTIEEKRFEAADGRKSAHQGGPRVAAPAGVLERMPVQMNRDASRFSRWRISFFGKPASTFPGYALGRTGSYGLKVDSDVSSGIKRRMRIRGNNAGRVVFFDDQRSDAPCRKVRAPDDRRSHPPAPATEIRVTRR